MSIFNWNDRLIGIPSNWRTTNGQNVKIAILDSGLDLSHPALSHLDVADRKFNVAKPGFDPDNDPLAGDDDVADAVPFMKAHGTHCASIIAAKPVNGNGVGGLAPSVELFIMKIIDDAKESLLDYFIKAMKVAIKKQVDIISVSYFPLFRDPVDQAAIETVMKLAVDNKICVVATLENTSKLNRLNNLKFPASRAESIAVGVCREKLLEKWPANGTLKPAIQMLTPQSKVKYCTLFNSSKYIESKMSSSYATAALSGVIALMISHWKATETNYQPRSKADIITALAQITLPFNVQQMLNQPSFQFYKPS